MPAFHSDVQNKDISKRSHTPSDLPDAAHGVKLFKSCRPGPGSCKDYQAGTERTCSNTQNSVSACWFPLRLGRPHHTVSPGSVWHSSQSGDRSPSLTTAGQTSPSGDRSLLFTMARLPSEATVSSQQNQPVQHRGRHSTSSAEAQSRSLAPEEPYLTGGSTRGSDWLVRPEWQSRGSQPWLPT